MMKEVVMCAKNSERRTVSSQLWEWRDADVNLRGHWKSVVAYRQGNLVMVFPPSGGITSWYINVCDEESYELRGEHVEQRAFSVATGFIRQHRGPLTDLHTLNRKEEARMDDRLTDATAASAAVERNVLTDAKKLRIAALRTHLQVAANSRELFSERLSRLRSAYQLLAGRREYLGASKYANFTAQYNDVRLVLDASLYPGREFLSPEIRA